jgi:hypothetical protein
VFVRGIVAALQHLQFGPHVTVVPVVHGSGDFAIEIRRLLLAEAFDAVAVPLPACFQEPTEAAIERLPEISVVWQREQPLTYQTEWTPETDLEADTDPAQTATYVPIDPCQPVITALRFAIQSRMPRQFIDAEVTDFVPITHSLPDPYAVKRLQQGRFSAAVLPVLASGTDPQLAARAEYMARQLQRLASRHRKILALSSFAEWLPLRAAWDRLTSADATESQADPPAGPPTDVQSAPASANSLLFLLGRVAVYRRAVRTGPANSR